MVIVIGGCNDEDYCSWGVNTSWKLSGTLGYNDVSEAGTGSVFLSGTVTTTTNVLNATLTINFTRDNNGWNFTNLPLIICSGNDNDYSGTSWSVFPLSEYSAGYYLQRWFWRVLGCLFK